MSLEQVEEIGKEDRLDSKFLGFLAGAKIIGGVKYNLGGNLSGYDSSYFCYTCDCVCNQPCHGEGPCYSL